MTTTAKMRGTEGRKFLFNLDKKPKVKKNPASTKSLVISQGKKLKKGNLVKNSKQ